MSRHTNMKMLLQNNIQSKIQKFLGFGKVVLMLEQSPFWINNTRWWTKCTLKRQKVSSWHHFFKEGKITVSPQLTSKNRNSISKALSSLKFPCSVVREVQILLFTSEKRKRLVERNSHPIFFLTNVEVSQKSFAHKSFVFPKLNHC